MHDEPANDAERQVPREGGTTQGAQDLREQAQEDRGPGVLAAPIGAHQQHDEASPARNPRGEATDSRPQARHLPHPSHHDRRRHAAERHHQPPEFGAADDDHAPWRTDREARGPRPRLALRRRSEALPGRHRRLRRH